MSNGPAIVIKGECGVWPGGPRTLTALPADREPNSQTFWFSVRLEPGNKEVFFLDRFGSDPPDAGEHAPGARQAPCRTAYRLDQREPRPSVGGSQRLPSLCLGRRRYEGRTLRWLIRVVRGLSWAAMA